jgi:hypothetical protein
MVKRPVNQTLSTGRSSHDLACYLENGATRALETWHQLGSQSAAPDLPNRAALSLLPWRPVRTGRSQQPAGLRPPSVASVAFGPFFPGQWDRGRNPKWRKEKGRPGRVAWVGPGPGQWPGHPAGTGLEPGAIYCWCRSGLFQHTFQHPPRNRVFAR